MIRSPQQYMDMLNRLGRMPPEERMAQTIAAEEAARADRLRRHMDRLRQLREAQS